MNHQADDSLSTSVALDIDKICDHFEESWVRGGRPLIEDYMAHQSGLVRSALLRGLLEIELEHRGRGVESPTKSEYLSRFPDDQNVIADLFQKPTVRDKSDILTSNSGLSAKIADPNRKRIGRHQLIREIGKGGFGTVYLALDQQLRRQVAIKIPHLQRVSDADDVEAYLDEARVVASLDHPHIVPVYDVGRTDAGLCYIVSKYIQGRDLTVLIRHQRPSPIESADLIVAVAQALHHAHLQGVFHRDIKPSNILIDSDGTPYVADFGLALKDEPLEGNQSYVGAPAYMSPEQARGESHLVDGRSDVFSLGVVLYELLTGTRPFSAASRRKVLEQVKTREARPPRQIDPSIPRGLERICLKAMSKRATDRYSTAADMAEELKEFLGTTQDDDADALASSRGGIVRIVPKGLRSYDATDAEFFLQLLPGPRDRESIPESVRFWQTRLEQTVADQTFRVGLIYGPSGCGKSSFVKAGLIPRLASHVHVVFVEATSDTTAIQLRRSVLRQFPSLCGDADLPALLSAIRKDNGTQEKLVIVLDQFEQWLHGRNEKGREDLVQALRHCDGGRVQCVLMVRDDFWMGVTRFMQQLEVRLVEGENSAAVDLFDSEHALKILAEFGKAHGRLSYNPDELSRNQKAFLSSAIEGLGHNEKVMPVRLALFVQMVKGRPWLPATLKALGGIEGVGVTYLEETFCGPLAPPKCRSHEKAARGVLAALLPLCGVPMKTHVRSSAELAQASGYEDKSAEFHDLLSLLERETRLIAPVDSEVQQVGDNESGTNGVKPDLSDNCSSPAFPHPGRQFQLTHDYLVPSIRQWLARKQKETWRGRAELRLDESADLWHAKPDTRYLPAWWDFLTIKCLVPRKRLTESQRAVMQHASSYYTVRCVIGLLAMAMAVAAGWSAYRPWHNAHRATELVQRLLDARIAEVRGIVTELQPYRNWADSDLARISDHSTDSGHRLRAALALLSTGNDAIVDQLTRRMLESEPDDFLVIRDALKARSISLAEKLWAIVENKVAPSEQRFRAACALATYAPVDTSRWEDSSDEVADQLVLVSPVFVDRWIDSLRPVRQLLLPKLENIFRDADRDDLQRYLAARVLADYVGDRASAVVHLLIDSDPQQFAVLFSELHQHQLVDDVIPLLEAVLRNEQSIAEDKTDRLAKQKANAALTLLGLNRSQDLAWSLMRHSPDPRARTYMIHRLHQYGVRALGLVEQLTLQDDPSVRRALVLSLGQYSHNRLPPNLVEVLLGLYQNDVDCGVHAAVEWLLRRWGQDARIRSVDQQLRIRDADGLRQWFINQHGLTMVVLDADEFQMGSPPNEDYRLVPETQHTRQINRSFAIASKEITQSQFQMFLEETGTQFSANSGYSPPPDAPQDSVTWYLAAHYCNWLSAKEGIPVDQWCYVTNESGEYASRMRPANGYLSKSGYRLPTEAEWEFACRAGAVTSRCYGNADLLLSHYACYDANSDGHSHPVGRFKPNDFGLFDMHGNVWEWTNSRGVDNEDAANAQDDGVRILRGGAWASPVRVVRSATRYVALVAASNIRHGFRVVRTIDK